MSERNPCLSCGACCVLFRASFHWMETDDATPGGVPAGLVEPLTDHLVCMKGTRAEPVRCVALEGIVGVSVRCAIHDRRASVCRDFQASWSAGSPNERCDGARAIVGLAPLGPCDWVAEPPEVPPRVG